MKTIPKLKLGIIAVSRDCFPVELSRKRRIQVAKECRAKKIPVVAPQTVVENETHVLAAEQELRDKGVNALVIFLGNFGPEGPTTLLAQKVEGPVMFAGGSRFSPPGGGRRTSGPATRRSSHSTTSASRSWRTASSTSTIFFSQPRATPRSRLSPGTWARSLVRGCPTPTSSKSWPSTRSR